MNLAENQVTSDHSRKRGLLASKLLQAAKRKKRAPAALEYATAEALEPQAAKVLGPYENGSKWRLVVKEGQGRKSLVFATEAEALAVRAELLARFDDRANQTIGQTIEEYIDERNPISPAMDIGKGSM